MKIVINHMTRMHGGHICVAGVDVETHRHVRPVGQHGGLTAHLLARYGGPFDMARIVDLGRLRPEPDRPHVEDHVFVPAWAKLQESICAEEFWNLLHYLSKSKLREIFGAALRPVGRSRWGTDLGKGTASLGCFRPRRPPDLYLAPGRERRCQVRINLSDGEIQADAGVTDLRLFQGDHATVDEDKVRGVAKWIYDSEGVILSVGLTRKFRRSEQSQYIHWLQVNNVHLKEDPAWLLGD